MIRRREGTSTPKRPRVLNTDAPSTTDKDEIDFILNFPCSRSPGDFVSQLVLKEGIGNCHVQGNTEVLEELSIFTYLSCRKVTHMPTGRETLTKLGIGIHANKKKIILKDATDNRLECVKEGLL